MHPILEMSVGRSYRIDHLDNPKEFTVIRFSHPAFSATQSLCHYQILFPILIDRVTELDREIPCPINQDILNRLRMALSISTRNQSDYEYVTNSRLMECTYPGHTYIIYDLKNPNHPVRFQTIQFVQRQPNHQPKSGIICQDLLRCIIMHLRHVEGSCHLPEHQLIINLAQQTIALFEARALIRKAELGKIDFLDIDVDEDDHHIALWSVE